MDKEQKDNKLTPVKDIYSLESLRKQIAKIDRAILMLLEMRMDTAIVIGRIKKERKMPVYCPGIESQKIISLSELSSYEGLVETIWPVIMCYTRTLE